MSIDKLLAKEQIQIDVDDSDGSTPTASTFSHPIPNMLQHCELIQSSTEALDNLRTLPSRAIILLLTPVMVLPEELAFSGRPQADPFEHLGRSLSKRHARIRHVPYISKIGFTNTHLAFMRQANAVIIVTIGSTHAAVQGMKDAGLHLSTTDSVYEIEEERMTVPTALIQFGGKPAKHNKETNQEVLIHAPYASEEAFDTATCLLFGPQD